MSPAANVGHPNASQDCTPEEAQTISAVTAFPFRCKRTQSVLLPMQAMLSLQHEISKAELEVALWKASSQVAQSSFDSSDARRIEVEGQLLAKSNEVDGLRQASAHHSVVSVHIYSSCCFECPQTFNGKSICGVTVKLRETYVPDAVATVGAFQGLSHCSLPHSHTPSLYFLLAPALDHAPPPPAKTTPTLSPPSFHPILPTHLPFIPSTWAPKLKCKVELIILCELICTALASLQHKLQVPTNCLPGLAEYSQLAGGEGCSC